MACPAVPVVLEAVETVLVDDMFLHLMVTDLEVAHLEAVHADREVVLAVRAVSAEARAQARVVVLVVALAEDREVALAAILVTADSLREAVADLAEMVVILAAAEAAVFLPLQSLLLAVNENHASRKQIQLSLLHGRQRCNFHSGAGTLVTRSRRLQAGP